MEKLVKGTAKSDAALDMDKTDECYLPKPRSWKVFPLQSGTVINMEGYISTTEQQRIVADIMNKFPITNEAIWGVKATMDELFKTQGIIATNQKNPLTEDNEEQGKLEWEKMLQLCGKETGDRVLDKESDLKDMKETFYNKDQQKALRLAINNMKLRSLRAVDQSYEKPIRYDPPTEVPPSKHCLVSCLVYFGGIVFLCMLLVVFIGLGLYLSTGLLSSVVCSTIAPGFTGPKCSQKFAIVAKDGKTGKVGHAHSTRTG